MKICLSAGHTLKSGAVGLLNESQETRKVANEMAELLKSTGNTVYPCTIDTGDATKALSQVIAMCNKTDGEVAIQIHFNMMAKDTTGNGKTTGVEVYIASENSKAKDMATRIASSIAETGLRNRGVKVKKLSFLAKTNMPAILIECCFLDDKDDIKLYDYKTMAKKIVEGIIGEDIENEKIDYSPVFDMNYYANRYRDLGIAKLDTYDELLNHFLKCGIYENRQACPTFNIKVYKDNNSDLRDAYKSDMLSYIHHYIRFGQFEHGRIKV